jgi:hypothetical protein
MDQNREPEHLVPYTSAWTNRDTYRVIVWRQRKALAQRVLRKIGTWLLALVLVIGFVLILILLFFLRSPGVP